MTFLVASSLPAESIGFVVARRTKCSHIGRVHNAIRCNTNWDNVVHLKLAAFAASLSIFVTANLASVIVPSEDGLTKLLISSSVAKAAVSTTPVTVI